MDHALVAGWSLGRVCGVLELDRARLWRWRARAGRLDDLAGGGNPIHALLPWEVEEILALAEVLPPGRAHKCSA